MAVKSIRKLGKMQDAARANILKLPDAQKNAVGTLMEFVYGTDLNPKLYRCFENEKVREKKLSKVAKEFINKCSDTPQLEIMKNLPLTEKRMGEIEKAVEEKSVELAKNQ
ncbi:hypothetical protein COU37_00040 [Candidatus Micrarchaeota archaeon CG10_big_fil_rev_8_21_14_0_10_45_29]|nr:MAG: hypothetical protein COU37_00040 [Candidatus Micrarchaeota archaeon CG10_big_fil_rev_8_21_14_0_10_45_29]